MYGHVHLWGRRSGRTARHTGALSSGIPQAQTFAVSLMGPREPYSRHCWECQLVRVLLCCNSQSISVGLFLFCFIHHHVVAFCATCSSMFVMKLILADMTICPRGRRGCGSERRRRIAFRAQQNLRPIQRSAIQPPRPRRHGRRTYSCEVILLHRNPYLGRAMSTRKPFCQLAMRTFDRAECATDPYLEQAMPTSNPIERASSRQFAVRSFTCVSNVDRMPAVMHFPPELHFPPCRTG